MSKLSVEILIAMLVLGVVLAPVNAQSSNHFSIVKVYWGTDQPKEVSAGDTATLSVVLRYEYQYSIKSLKAELSLPDGFKAVGGGQKALVYYTSAISLGSVIKLDFLVFITSDAGKGSYTTNLQLDSYIPDLSSWRIEILAVMFEVTGKPSLDIQALNSTIHEGSQQILLALSNKGDGVADSIKIMKAYSSSASVELPDNPLVGKLDPGQKQDTFLLMKIPSDLKSSVLSLTVEISCAGPSGVSYSFSKDLQLTLRSSTLISPLMFALDSKELIIGSNSKLGFEVRNNGSSTLSDIELSLSPDPALKIFGSSTFNVGSLQAGETRHIYADVYVPSTTTASTSSLSLTVTYFDQGRGIVKSDDQTLNMFLRTSTHLVFCQFPGRSAAPGDTVQFQVRLKNPFEVETRFKISLESVPTDWMASVKSESGEYVTEAILGSNEFADVVVDVKSPDSGKIGEEYGLSVMVKSYGGNIVDSLPLNIALMNTTLTEVGTKIKIAAKFSEITVEAGKVIQYPITIINPGDVDRLLLLSVEPPVDWKVVFKSGDLEVSRLYLEAGGSENLVIQATPPSTANIGAYPIRVQIRSESGTIYAETSLRATIVGSYTLKLEPSTLLTSVTIGGSTTFTVKITDTGYTFVTSARVGVETPSGWESSITPTQVGTLKSKESSTFTLVIKTPGDTVSGDYLVTLTGLSDQVNSDSVQVRVTAATSTSWGLIGVGMAVVMVAALVFVFMKFRRR